MTRSEIDRLGDRLRHKVTVEDLNLLDAYRRSFHASYEFVVDGIQRELGLSVTGRRAKSTVAIVDKLGRESMRLSQMQDIAGCRVVVPGIAEQNRITAALAAMFEAEPFDRRSRPSYGYRAVHIVARVNDQPVEIQIRTTLQHLWAELSEKFADRVGVAIKYGGGRASVRRTLDVVSSFIAEYEDLEDQYRQDNRLIALKNQIRIDIETLIASLREGT